MLHDSLRFSATAVLLTVGRQFVPNPVFARFRFRTRRKVGSIRVAGDPLAQLTDYPFERSRGEVTCNSQNTFGFHSTAMIP
jgi:hypothetical protein